jgi:elongator complex protein 6
MTSRIPPLLEPYISLPPEASLILLTNVLGASTNWVVLRYLYSALAPEGDGDSDNETKIVLASFLRDMAFWKDGARRLVCPINSWLECAIGRGLSRLYILG